MLSTMLFGYIIDTCIANVKTCASLSFKVRKLRADKEILSILGYC